VQVRLATDADGDTWDAFVATRPEAGFAHRFALRRLFRDVHGLATPYWIAEENGRIVGVCPLVKVHSLLHRARPILISVPMVTDAGLLAGSEPARAALVRQLEAFGAAERAPVQLRTRAGTAVPGVPGFEGYVSFSLELAGVGTDDYWRGLSSRNRGKIRKSRSAGTGIVFGREELLDAFHRLHVAHSAGLGTPPYPRRWFAGLLQHFPGTELALARSGSATIAGMFNVGVGTTLHYLYGSSDRRRLASYPNNQLLHAVIERARARGFERIDLGRSPRAGGTHAFKSQWLASEVPLYYQSLGPGAASLANLSIRDVQQTLAFRAFRHVWAHWVPHALVARLGPSLIKRMPLA
jgi:hypothetical protein